MDIKRVGALLSKESVWCFTCDIDWSPEWAVEEVMAIFDEKEIPLTVFVTHDSEAIRRRYGNTRKSRHVGVHPNFFPGSSHGSNYVEVIDFCQKLWPSARSFRAHGYFENTHIIEEFCRRGFVYDSNLCLFLYPYCVPLPHWSGLIRFPVFWEDDVHGRKGLPFKLEAVKKHLDSPGLKIVNVHPLNLAINCPTSDYYVKHKFLYKTADTNSWRKYVFEGAGEQVLLRNMISHLEKKEEQFYYLDDVYEKLVGV